MITFENMASFICYYGGFSYDELALLREEKLASYAQTGNDRDKKRADQFSLLMKMVNEQVTFEECLTTSAFYYQPRQGWEVLHDYLGEDSLDPI